MAVQSALQQMGIGGLPELGQQFKGAQKEAEIATSDYDTAKRMGAATRQQGAQKVEAIRQQAPAQPEFAPIPDKFEHKGLSNEDMTQNMQAMFAFAAIGGAMTRQPVTAAMNAFAGGMKGLVAGDKIAYERGMDEFKTGMQAAIAKNNSAVQKYKMAFEKHKGDLQAALQEIQLEAAAHNDTATGALARSNNAKQVMTQIQGMVKSEQNMQTQLAKMQQHHDEVMSRMKMDSDRLAETQRHNQATEGLTRDRNATYAQRVAAAGQSGLKGKAADSFVHNESNIEALNEVLQSINAQPGAFGAKTLVPGIILNRFDAEGTPVRASLANITSMTIKDRAGTAQTASEMKNLAPFIPRDGDDEQTVKTKISGMVKEMTRMNQHLAAGPGARPAGAPAAPTAAAGAVAPKNSKGWSLHEDAQGNKAYVGPKGEVEEVQ